jgi:ribulose-5-phosphate 4-epimerase/fuculose-1-phosphate aldolase
MSEYRPAREQIVEAARRLSDRGFLVATGGNLSVRIAGQDAFAVTPSTLDYRRMTAEDVCVLDGRLNILAGERKPSVESALHAAVYRVRGDVNAVVHTHQTHASALALVDAPIPALFDEQVRFLGRSVEIVPYGPSGTWFLRRGVERCVKTHANAYLLKNHGVICLGPDLERAANNVELLEKCAVAYLLALSTERPVSTIPRLVREVAFQELRSEQRRAERELLRGPRGAS